MSLRSQAQRRLHVVQPGYRGRLHVSKRYSRGESYLPTEAWAFHLAIPHTAPGEFCLLCQMGQPSDGFFVFVVPFSELRAQCRRLNLREDGRHSLYVSAESVTFPVYRAGTLLFELAPFRNEGLEARLRLG
jgi:hypothetical protein